MFIVLQPMTLVYKESALQLIPYSPPLTRPSYSLKSRFKSPRRLTSLYARERTITSNDKNKLLDNHKTHKNGVISARVNFRGSSVRSQFRKSSRLHGCDVERYFCKSVDFRYYKRLS